MAKITTPAAAGVGGNFSSLAKEEERQTPSLKWEMGDLTPRLISITMAGATIVAICFKRQFLLDLGIRHPQEALLRQKVLRFNAHAISAVQIAIRLNIPLPEVENILGKSSIRKYRRRKS